MQYYQENYKSHLKTPVIPQPSGNYSGTTYISGYTSIGYTPKKKPAIADVRYERDRDKYRFVKKKTWHHADGVRQEIVCQPIGKQAPPTRFIDAHKLSQALEQPKKRYGLKGISKAGRIKVREGAYLLHRMFPKKLGFYTLTCPYTEPSSIYEFNRNINIILRRYFEMIKRAIPCPSLHLYVSVLEVQEQRYLEDKGFALHIHYVMPCYKPGTTQFLFTANELRAFWYRACNNCIGGEPDVMSAIDAVVVRKSASGYISKYMSKGGRLQSEVADVAPSQLPKQWWSMSALMRKVLQISILSLHPETAEYLFYNAERIDEHSCFTVHHMCYATIHERDVCVGVAGYLTDEWKSALWQSQRLRECHVFVMAYKSGSTLDKVKLAS